MTNQTYVMAREDVPSVWLGEGKKEKEKKKQSRLSKGVVIATSRSIVKVGEGVWLVESEKIDGKFYRVTEDGECSCYDNSQSHNVCKHVHAVIRRGIA